MTFDMIPIGDLGRVVTGRTPPAANPEFYGEAYPFITPTDIQGGARYVETIRGLSAEGLDAFHRILLPHDAICVVCIGATIGKICLSSRPSFTNQQINSIVVDEDKYDPRYVFYAARLLQDELRAKAAGAATPILNKSAFQNIEIPVPDLPVQRRIAGILSAYDDLIDVNQRRIAILEEMARRLFDEWFVRFRYPGHEAVPLVETELGNVPEGWAVEEARTAFRFLGGGTPSKTEDSYWTDGTIPWFTPTDLTKSGRTFLDQSELKITDLGLSKSAARLFPANSIMMTSRATLGVFGINTQEATTNQGFITFIPNQRTPLYFLLHLLKREFPRMEAVASGATFKEVTKGALGELLFAIPPEALTHRFEVLAVPIMEQVRTLTRQNTHLRTARDLLLPKLISGEIDVGRAEETLARAAE